MGQRILEGTWEDIARRGPELAGRRVRVTVLDEIEAPMMLDCTLGGLIAEAERLSGGLPPPSAPDSVEPWAEGVSAKFRRQGFRI